MSDLQWKIYYADGSIYSNLNGSPESAPSNGVIAIVQKSGVIQGHNYYWYEGEWVNGHGFDLYDYLARNSRVKFGERRFTEQEATDVLERVNKDPDFRVGVCRTNHSMPF